MDLSVILGIVVGSASLIGLMYYKVKTEKGKKEKLYKKSRNLSVEDVLEELQLMSNDPDRYLFGGSVGQPQTGT